MSPALGALLAGLLLVSGLLSVSHSLHQSLHHDGDGVHHFCLVCLFAKGQVSVAEVASGFTFVFLARLCGIQANNTVLLPGFDYSLSLSRAPPRS
jgi:hypothetical protein